MPPLPNTRHEAFARALLERPKTGMTLAQCYEAAGYRTRGHSSETMGSRLSLVEPIQARLRELQGAVAKSAVISVESICGELDEAIAIAKERGQASAMVSASTLRAKLAGLLREKVELSGVGLYSRCDTKAQVAEQMLRQICDIEPTQEQIEQAQDLLTAQMAEWDALAHGRGPITIDAVAQPIDHRQNGRNR